MSAAGWFDGFQIRDLPGADGQTVRVRTGGRADAPPLVLLHGFPQTHAMWHRVAQRLAGDFHLLLPDVRGYGDTTRPPGGPEQAAYSKRTMAADVAAVLGHLGITSAFVCGHDRGGRVSHRLALDHPPLVRKLCVLDIAPTLDMYAATDMAFARAYYHWFHLIQPEPVPEMMIGGNAVGYLHAKLSGWGGRSLDFIEPRALAEYERCFCTPQGIHSACEDYRASAGIDLEHDRASRERGEKIACDLLVLWGERGVVNRLFKPLDLWRAQCAGHVSGETVPSGHYIPEELPERTADALRAFFSAG